MCFTTIKFFTLRYRCVHTVTGSMPRTESVRADASVRQLTVASAADASTYLECKSFQWCKMLWIVIEAKHQV